MKGLKLSLMVLTATMLALGLSGMAYAFHSGGVAACDGCHTMHGIYTTGSSTPAFAGKGPNLLVATDPSSTCLLCHAAPPAGSPNIGGGPRVMTYPFPGAGIAPAGFNVGGDFAWLQKRFQTSTSGAGTFEEGQTHGHNVIAADFGMLADPDFPGLSPGGNFSTNILACNSCHDPHGTYRRVGNNTSYQVGTPTQLGVNSLPISGSGSKGAAPVPGVSAVGTYRLLAGLGYLQGGTGGTPTNFPGVPIAVSPSTSGGTETTPSTQFRVAYANVTTNGVVPWGQWCGACHSQMMSSNASTHKHPVDVPLSGRGINAIYDSYVATGNPNGTNATSFLSLVPFMESQTDIGILTNHIATGYVVGPASTDQVSCLSCHRGHASGFKFALRWDMADQFLTNPTGWEVQNHGRSLAEANQSYMGRPFTYFPPNQRVLCNKCHMKD